VKGNNMPTEITTPVGRIVWGHPGKARTKTDQKTRQPVLDAQGQPRQQWSFGVAFDKATFQQYVWPALAAEAATIFPQGVPPTFSWKYIDGDSIDREGKPYNQRDGYAGCFVLAINTELMTPPIFKLVNGAYQQLPAESIKCGDFVSLGLSLKANAPTDRTQTPGLYVNPLAIEFVAYGTEIISQGAADPNAIFKGQQHQLPPGASATPVTTPGAPGMPGMGQQPAPGYPPQQPGMMPPPATDFIPGAPGMPGMGQQPAPGYPPQQPGMMPPR
jgi:hypothetical protein